MKLSKRIALAWRFVAGRLTQDQAALIAVATEKHSGLLPISLVDADAIKRRATALWVNGVSLAEHIDWAIETYTAEFGGRDAKAEAYILEMAKRSAMRSGMSMVAYGATSEAA